MATQTHSQADEHCDDGSFSNPTARSLAPVITSLVVLGLILTITAVRHVLTSQVPPPALPALASINPNTAPWWELIVLPDIGETTARKIVDYRESRTGESPVFNSPADLEPVPGIGPKTIQRISPFLRFRD